MSDTVRLIIEIPKVSYEWIVGDEACGLYPLTRAIAHGIPLDAVKAEMTALRYGSDTYKHAIDDVIEILDNIGKGE